MSKQAGRIYVAALSLAALLAYPVSIGPAAKLVANGTIGIGTFDWFYKPINIACIKWPPLLDAVSWYIGLWTL